MGPYEQYYVNQAGSGIAGFGGVRYQRGSGIWGNIANWGRRALTPILKFLAPRVLKTGVNIAQDVIDNPEERPFKSILKRRLIEGGKTIASEGWDATKDWRTQRGFGRRKRRRRIQKKSIKRTKKRTSKRKIKRVKKQRRLKFNL